MLANNRLSVEAQLYVDGKRVTNFFSAEVQLIEPDSPQANRLLKRYDPFTGEIKLSRKQCWRLIRLMTFEMVQGWGVKYKVTLYH